MDARVQTVIALMAGQLKEPLYVTELARSVNLSMWRLCHLFKEQTDMAPHQYLRVLRMEEAKKLLETTFLSVKQIMIEVGIRDESHFVRNFKAAYGLSPMKFRISITIKNPRTAEIANLAKR